VLVIVIVIVLVIVLVIAIVIETRGSRLVPVTRTSEFGPGFRDLDQ